MLHDKISAPPHDYTVNMSTYFNCHSPWSCVGQCRSKICKMAARFSIYSYILAIVLLVALCCSCKIRHTKVTNFVPSRRPAISTCLRNMFGRGPRIIRCNTIATHVRCSPRPCRSPPEGRRRPTTTSGRPQHCKGESHSNVQKNVDQENEKSGHCVENGTQTFCKINKISLLSKFLSSLKNICPFISDFPLSLVLLNPKLNPPPTVIFFNFHRMDMQAIAYMANNTHNQQELMTLEEFFSSSLAFSEDRCT